MSKPGPGNYRVTHVGRGSKAALTLCCPFCQLGVHVDVAKRQVHPVPLPFYFECPRCGVKETYAPKTQARPPRPA